MLLPDMKHILNRHILRLREEEVDESSHDCNPHREKVEEPKLEVA